MRISILAGLLLAPSILGAQVPVSGRGVSLTAFDTLGGGEYVYTYAVERDPRLAKTHKSLERFYIDISTGPGKNSGLTGIRGEFLFDATSRPGSKVGHAPVFVGTPAKWLGLINVSGYVGWNVASDGVISGTGFVLRSKALPAIRYWTVIATLPLPIEGIDRPIDPTIVTPYGYTLGPGVLAEQVTSDYVLDQVEEACAARAVDKCDGLMAIARGLRGAPGGARAIVLRQMLDFLNRNKVHPMAKTALVAAIAALAKTAGSGH